MNMIIQALLMGLTVATNLNTMDNNDNNTVNCDTAANKHNPVCNGLKDVAEGIGGALIGIIVGIVLCICCCIVCCIMMSRRQNNMSNGDNNYQNMNG